MRTTYIGMDTSLRKKTFTVKSYINYFSYLYLSDGINHWRDKPFKYNIPYVLALCPFLNCYKVRLLSNGWNCTFLLEGNTPWHPVRAILCGFVLLKECVLNWISTLIFPLFLFFCFLFLLTVYWPPCNVCLLWNRVWLTFHEAENFALEQPYEPWVGKKGKYSFARNSGTIGHL